SGKNIIRWLLKKRTNGSVRYCQYTSVSNPPLLPLDRKRPSVSLNTMLTVSLPNVNSPRPLDAT
ncbi:hypothetical protein, partial [Escherichia coli]|uniref:hypothetical protein n=1 Tax=Escherichia coli TaxID=562 RepID=UPI0027D1F974